MPNETITDAEMRVRGATRGLTDSQIAAVAAHHVETGDCVWHSTHVVLRTERCNCFTCRAPGAAQ